MHFLHGHDVENVFLSLADGEPALNLPLVTDPGGDPHSTLDVRAVTVKPDKMEETLTCIICQDLLHDCVRCGHRARGAADGAGLCVRPAEVTVAVLLVRLTS